jgi:hypothetical protein
MMKNYLLSLIGCSMIAFAQPAVISISPLNGSSTTATFTSVYRHAGGVNKNYLEYLLILPTPNIVWFTATGSCLVEYNRISNGMRLINNAGNGWLGGQSGVPVGAGGSVLSNNYCSVNTAAVQVAFGATDITTTIPLTFTGNLSGVMGTFLQTLDVDGNWTGMTQFGNWTAYALTQPKPGPYIGAVTVPPYTLWPSSVDVVSGHTSGYTNLSMVNILVADSIVGGTNRCHIIYFGATKDIKLVNDAGTGFVQGSPVINSTCIIGNTPTEALSASGSGNEVRIHVPMDFNSNTVHQKLKVWINSFDNYGNLTHWQGAQ